MKDMLQMEQQVLSALRFELNVTTAFTFLETFLTVLRCRCRVSRFFAQFLLECCLTELQMLRFEPSTLALAALMCTVRKLNEKGAIYVVGLGCGLNCVALEVLIQQQAINEQSLMVCAQQMMALTSEVGLIVNSIKQKYSQASMLLVQPLVGLIK